MAFAIGYRNRVDGGTVSTGSSEGTLPVTNLQNAHVVKPWRSLTTTSTYLLCDMGLSTSVGGTALVALNTSATATYRVRLSTVDTTGVAGNAYDSGTISTYSIDPIKKMFVHLFGPATGRYVRVDITDTSLTYFQAGRWFVGTVWTTSKTQSFGWEWTWDETTRSETSDGGQEWVERGVVRRGINFELPYVGYSEMLNDWESLVHVAGQREDILIVADTGDLPESSLWGRVSVPYGITHPGPSFRRTGRLTIMERK